MTDILCRWLNEEVHLEPKLTGDGFAEQFSNGYLFGEILHRHGLQNDFPNFSTGRSSEAKLNNFMRLEPTFRLLEIPFNINMARDVMTEKPGVATRLMYQLFVALNRKKQRQLTGQSLECMRPSGKVKLEKIETGIFQEQLKHQTPRQVDLNFQTLISRFHQKQRQHEELVAREKEANEKRLQEERKEACQKALEKSCQVRERQTQMYAKLKPITSSKSAASRKSKSPHPSTSSQKTAELLAGERVRHPRSKAIAAETRASIDEFESSMRGKVAAAPGQQDGVDMDAEKLSGMMQTVATGPTADLDYVSRIKRRVQDGLSAREDREKRRRKVLVEQLKAMHEQEEERREKMLVERLMRQCQQERRIATQLMQIRREKDTIRNNRIFRQQQLEEARLREFQEALDKEAQLAKQGELEKQQRLQFHRELYQKNLAEKAKVNYAKNYTLCQGVLMQILDFATKMAHYRDLTQGLVPAKIVRDWKMLFIAGRPLYEGEGDMSDAKSSSVSGSSTYDPTRRTHADNQQLLDDTDFNEYKDCHDEWNPPIDLTNELPLPPNPILSHVVYRLLDMVDPPKAPPTPPKFPKSLLRASFIGKPFTGKSTTLQRLQENYSIVVLSVESVLTKAVDTFFAEKKRFENRESHNEGNGVQGTGEREEGEEEEDAPVISNTDEAEEKVPAIMVEPSSSVDINMSSSITSVPSKANEEGQQEVTGSADSALNELPEDTLEHLSPMARLGYKAHIAMASGEPLDDETAVEIFVEEIRQLPEGNCWVMDNFPSTLEQAKVLATALTGQAKPQPTIPRQFALLAERQIQNEEQQLHSACGLDIVLHFTASSDAVLQRASQLASNIPGASNKLEQIQHRLMSFDDQWPILRRWYLRFRNVGTVNSNLSTEAVYSTARDKIQEVINKSKQAEAMKRLGLPEGLGSDFGSTSNISQFDVPSSQSEPTAAMPTSPAKRRRRPSSAESPAKLLQQLRSPKRKGGKYSSHDEEKPLVFSPINPNAEPGSSEWVYCNLPLGIDLAKGLARKWPGIEETYINTLKGVFQQLRNERENICQYFYDRRNEFADYLCRPDHKQEFVSQWQSLYNGLEPHLRREDAMKAELHHRVDDLCDQLWDITDTRRDQAEKERQRIATDHWLEDHIGILTNHFISVMQVELDRFYDTFMLLKDYYTGMEEKVPSKLPDPGRLALIELAPTETQEVPVSATGSTHDMEGMTSTVEGEREGEGEEREGETGKEHPHQSDTKPSKDSPKRRVPLLPHRPLPDPTEDKGAKKKGGGAGGVQSPQPPIEDLSNLELDHQLVVHAFNTANAVVFHLVMGELKALEGAIMEVSKPPSAKLDVEQESKSAEAGGGKEDKSAGKGKKGKSPAPGKKGKASPAVKGKGSPAKPGKGGAQAAEAPPTETSAKAHIETPEQLAQRQQVGHLYKEHKAAIEKEENRVKLRLVLIKEKALAQINEYKAKDKATNTEMERWIQDCYKQEVDCVSTLSQVLRQAIENEEKLVNELALPGAKLEIRQSIVMFEGSPPPSPVPMLEPQLPDRFTVDQLLSLHEQLQVIAPSGYMLGRELIDTLVRLSNQAQGGEILPDNWRNLSKEQAEVLRSSLYGANSDFVDWRQFIVCAAQPWPRPSAQDLLDAMHQFSPTPESIDTSTAESSVMKDSLSSTLSKPVWINREQYMTTELWLTRAGPQLTGDEGEGENGEKFDRDQKLKEAFYDIFSDSSTGLLDCHSLLLYLCADPEPREGLCKALTLAVGSPVTSLNPADTLNSDATLLLEDFHKIVSHGVHPDTQVERTLTMSDLLEVFLALSPSNPNEVSLSSLLSSPTSMHYLTAASNKYTLTDFAVIFQPPSQQNETE